MGATTKAKIEYCECGSAPIVKSYRIAEDQMTTYVFCQNCGRHGDAMEDAYSDEAGAVEAWNSGNRFS